MERKNSVFSGNKNEILPKSILFGVSLKKEQRKILFHQNLSQEPD